LSSRTFLGQKWTQIPHPLHHSGFIICAFNLGFAMKISFYSVLKNLVLPRNTGSLMGQACPALRESEFFGSAVGVCI